MTEYCMWVIGFCAPMPTFAAFWSAIAASFAAVASIFSWRTQRQNLLESVRPELVLVGWSREPERTVDGRCDIIHFHEVKNIGKGAAHGVLLRLQEPVGRANGPATLTYNRLPILGVNESAVLDGQIWMWWNNVPGRESRKFLPVRLDVLTWDTRGMRYRTRYSFMVWPPLASEYEDNDTLAPGVTFSHRSTVRRPVKWLRFCSVIARIRPRKV